ncbi:MAG: hypothetical protein QXO30_07825 [Candidatus Caldarchaeum sp.]
MGEAAWDTRLPKGYVFVGVVGHPVDKRFTACLDMAVSASRPEPGRVVAFMFESSEGLGEESLLRRLWAGA